jgi:hypothetical protein
MIRARTREDRTDLQRHATTHRLSTAPKSSDLLPSGQFAIAPRLGGFNLPRKLEQNKVPRPFNGLFVCSEHVRKLSDIIEIWESSFQISYIQISMKHLASSSCKCHISL